MKQFGCFELDTANQRLVRAGTPIELAPKPFAVLRYLVEHPGRLIPHDELLDALWPETYVQPQVLRTYMLELRKVLGDDAACPRFIQTLPKRGYRFIAPVTEPAGPMPNGKPRAATLETCPAAIVGRDRELELLHAHVRHIASGQRRVLFLSGEAGIGKTALVDAFCRQLCDSESATLARGQCVQGMAGKEEFYPVMEALSQLCAGPDREAACRILARLAPAWLRSGARSTETSVQSPERHVEAPPASHMATQQKTLGDLCGALEALAAENPLILVFEDLHWADDSTLHLLSALARRRAQAQLLVLATFCPLSVSSHDPVKALRQDLLVRRLCMEMPLAPLSKAGIGELVRRELKQQTVPQDLIDFVARRSEGNPLFVIAVIEHLVSEGSLARSCDGNGGECKQFASWPEIEAGVPEQLARMIELEIERLSEPAQQLLEAGSLMTVAFPAWAVAAALGQDAIETEEACDALAKRLHFVVRAGHDELPDGSTSSFYAFAHGLYREVLYHRQSPARRARRHGRIADRLGQLFAGREADVARERSIHYAAAGQHELAADILQSIVKPARETQRP